jgi:hypothetical protein
MKMNTSKPRGLSRFAVPVAGVALAGVALTGAGVVGAARGTHPGGRSAGPTCLVASAAGAQRQAAAPPSPAEPDARQRGGRDGAPPRGARATGPMPPFDFGWGAAKNRADLRLPRQSEWSEVQNFMGRYSPLRQAAVDALPDDEKKDAIKKFVFARYRSLQALQKRDWAAYEQRLTQLTIEDQIFGLVHQWRGTDKGDEPQEDRQQLRAALRPQVTKLVELDLQERRRRVEWLKKELADQAAQLERDEKEQDGLIERRVARFADWADRWAARRARQGKKDGQDATPNVEASPSRPPAAPPARQKQD